MMLYAPLGIQRADDDDLGFLPVRFHFFELITYVFTCRCIVKMFENLDGVVASERIIRRSSVRLPLPAKKEFFLLSCI